MKTFGILVAVSTALTMVACNKGGGVGESSKPAATTAAVGLNNGGSVAPPPPVRNQPPRNSQVGDDRILSDDTTLHEDRDPVLPSRPQTSERRREQATPVVDVPPSQRSLQCCEAFRESSPEWFPGLPNPPSQEPIFTDLAGKSGLRYTDARQDGLFALAVERANALPAQMQKANQEFAKQIRDVKISVDLNKTRMVKVQVVYQHRMRKAAIELRGQLERATEVRLVQVPVPGQAINDQSFGGVLTCADSDHGCKNILLRLDLKARDSQKILRTVYVVHRWGDAHITMSENERRSFARLPNQNQSAFAEYLSNTVNNTCLNVLADATAGRRQLPACALQRLQANCGGEDVKRPSAQAFGLRSWSAAYGRSAFELVLASNGSYDGVADYDSKRTQYMTV
ncbi:MAG: hypothetical protein ACXVA9_06770, partial [Bdellovibrionales bacterium]